MKRFVLENAGHGLVRPAGRGRGGRAEVVACVWVSTGGGLHRAGVREPKETGLGDGGGHLGSIRGGMERCVGLSPSKLRPKEKGVSPLWGGAAGLEGFLAEGPSGRAPCTWLPAHLSAPLGGEPGRERSGGRPVRGAGGEAGALGEWGRALRVGEQHGRRPGGEKVPAGVDSGSGGGGCGLGEAGMPSPGRALPAPRSGGSASGFPSCAPEAEPPARRGSFACTCGPQPAVPRRVAQRGPGPPACPLSRTCPEPLRLR